MIAVTKRGWNGLLLDKTNGVITTTRKPKFASLLPGLLSYCLRSRHNITFSCSQCNNNMYKLLIIDGDMTIKSEEIMMKEGHH